MNFGVTITTFLASSAQGNALHNGNVVCQHTGFPDYYACGMVHQNAGTDPGSRVNVYPEKL